MRERLAAVMEARLGLDPGEADVVAYGLYVLGLYAVLWASLAAAAAAAGVLGPALWAGLVAATVRVFAGGAHASRPTSCVALSTLVLVALAVAAEQVAGAPRGVAAGSLAAGLAVGLALLVWRAPRLAPGRTWGSQRRRRFLRAASLGTGAVWVALHLVAAAPSWPAVAPHLLGGAWALAWQAFTLTAAGERLVAWLDCLLLRAFRCRALCPVTLGPEPAGAAEVQ